ncbi:hypothetical protein CS542_03390 [Pedobacter sp. IW39]|nr:hypothetical protein CS542_03390 [Pedobacter sp. IW39]
MAVSVRMGADNYSFPSGHTANAFAAEFLNQEYRDVSPWIGYAVYTVATASRVLRMYNNKHWVMMWLPEQDLVLLH